jgi:hypothetical protein
MVFSLIHCSTAKKDYFRKIGHSRTHRVRCPRKKVYCKMINAKCKMQNLFDRNVSDSVHDLAHAI